jgi:hypothetical protein
MDDMLVRQNYLILKSAKITLSVVVPLFKTDAIADLGKGPLCDCSENIESYLCEITVTTVLIGFTSIIPITPLRKGSFFSDFLPSTRNAGYLH